VSLNKPKINQASLLLFIFFYVGDIPATVTA